jgi:hypothetical protein
MVAALEDIVTPDALNRAGAEFVAPDSEYLSTVVLIVPKAAEESFVETYAQLDDRSVPLGPEGRREEVRGSPVVPGSARRLAEDKDGYVLYTVAILKKFADSFRAACREKRYAVREFSYDPQLAGSVSREVDEKQKELGAALSQLKTESRRKYGEIMTVWFHVKALRVFVDSVLRFGLPVRFASILFRVNKPSGGGAAGQEVAAKLLAAVHAEWRNITGGGGGFDGAFAPATGKASGAAAAGAGDPIIPGVSDAAGTASQPFVFLDFDIKPDTSSLAK